MKSLNKVPCVFFDRDGVVNESPGEGYVTRWVDFRFREGIHDILQLVRNRTYKRILITNQQGVGKGLITVGDVEEIHRRMQSALDTREISFNAIYVATGLEGQDPSRKPNPAMLELAAKEHHLDLSRSWIIGDDDKDISAGQRAGVGTIRVRGAKPVSVHADHVVDDLRILHDLLSNLLERTEGLS